MKPPKHSPAATKANPAPTREDFATGKDYAIACMNCHEARVEFDKPVPLHPLMIDGKDWNRALVMAHICDLLATTSYGIGKILNSGYDGKPLPSYSTVMKWLEEEEILSDRYARAKEAQAEFMADEMLDIADDGRNDWMESFGKDGESLGYKINGDHVQRSRLRIDTRKWLASKLKPKKYGDKTILSGDKENPVAVLTMDQITVNPNSRIKLK